MLIGMNVKVKCFNCTARNELDIGSIDPKRKTKVNVACLNCGALNILNIDPRNLNDTKCEFLGELPEGFQWILPTGKITPITGNPIYMLSSGEQLSRNAYMERYRVDAEIAYQYIRRQNEKKKLKSIANKLAPTAPENSAANLWGNGKKKCLRRFWSKLY